MENTIQFRSTASKYNRYSTLPLYILIAFAISIAACKSNETNAGPATMPAPKSLDSAIIFYIGSKSIPFKLKLIKQNKNQQIAFDPNDDQLTRRNECTQCITDGNLRMAPAASLVIGLSPDDLSVFSKELLNHHPGCGNTYVMTYWNDNTWRNYSAYASNIELVFDSRYITKLASIHGKSFFEMIKNDPKSGGFGCM